MAGGGARGPVNMQTNNVWMGSLDDRQIIWSEQQNSPPYEGGVAPASGDGVVLSDWTACTISTGTQAPSPASVQRTLTNAANFQLPLIQAPSRLDRRRPRLQASKGR